MPQKHFPFYGNEKIVDPLQVKGHGAKMSALSINQSKKKVPELENALNFYQEYRNEPVPPDPSIISAVKAFSVVKPPPNTVSTKLDFGQPLKPKNKPLNLWLNKRHEPKKEAVIPQFRGIAKTVTIDFATSSETVAVDVNASLPVPELSFPSSSSFASITSTNKQVNTIRPTTVLEDLKPPRLFVEACSNNNPFVKVTVVSVFNACSFVIKAADWDLNRQLEELEISMFQSFTTDSVFEMKIKKHRVYALVVPERRICLRVLVLSTFKDDTKANTAMVFHLDHGSVEHVKISDLVPLKPEWKQLPQLACYARKCDVNMSPELELKEDLIFKNKFESKLITVKPLRGSLVPIEGYNSSGVQFTSMVKSCEVEFSVMEEMLENEVESIGINLENRRTEIEKWIANQSFGDKVENEKQIIPECDSDGEDWSWL